jgi:hypothetical protein
MASCELQYTKLMISFLACLLVISLIIPVYSQANKQRTSLSVCAFAKYPVEQFSISATYWVEQQIKTQDYYIDAENRCSYRGAPVPELGNAGMLVKFLFGLRNPPATADSVFYVCATNLSTQEKNCGKYKTPFSAINIEIPTSR